MNCRSNALSPPWKKVLTAGKKLSGKNYRIDFTNNDWLRFAKTDFTKPCRFYRAD
jgi:hypothetical protein